jgi:hypothetical protein
MPAARRHASLSDSYRLPRAGQCAGSRYAAGRSDCSAAGAELFSRAGPDSLGGLLDAVYVLDVPSRGSFYSQFGDVGFGHPSDL